MGEWREVKTLYGIREQWVPDTPGEWPEDVPDPACEMCGGKLQRHTSPTGAMLYAFAHYRDCCLPAPATQDVTLTQPRRV